MDEWMNLFNKYLVSTYYVPGPVVASRDTSVKKKSTPSPLPLGSDILGSGRMRQTENNKNTKYIFSSVG